MVWRNSKRCWLRKLEHSSKHSSNRNSRLPAISLSFLPTADFLSWGSQSLRGASVLKLHQFCSHLAAFETGRQANDINHWRRFVQDFYSPGGVMRQALWNSTTRETKQFEITTQVLARYYFTLFESGIRNVQIMLENTRETVLPNQGHIVDSPKTSFIYWFENGCHVSLFKSYFAYPALTMISMPLVGCYWRIEGHVQPKFTDGSARFSDMRACGLRAPVNSKPTDIGQRRCPDQIITWQQIIRKKTLTATSR